uniref:Uncharacterized protein n=1 Tax=Chionoecetes opilio bacilliform virus TaxID=1825681 RepID=A0A1Q3DL37_9VIRU|nr:hypothetical protein SCV_058 [Chionoecetes opilio bacilliform virus]
MGVQSKRPRPGWGSDEEEEKVETEYLYNKRRCKKHHFIVEDGVTLWSNPHECLSPENLSSNTIDDMDADVLRGVSVEFCAGGENEQLSTTLFNTICKVLDRTNIHFTKSTRLRLLGCGGLSVCYD